MKKTIVLITLILIVFSGCPAALPEVETNDNTNSPVPADIVIKNNGYIHMWVQVCHEDDLSSDMVNNGSSVSGYDFSLSNGSETTYTTLSGLNKMQWIIDNGSGLVGPSEEWIDVSAAGTTWERP